MAVSCDSIQVYRGLETLSGAATPEERQLLEHRLVGFVESSGEFSAGRFAALAHAEIDQLLAEGRRPIVVGGTGLYLRAALADLDLRPPVPPERACRGRAEIADAGPGGDPRRARPGRRPRPCTRAIASGSRGRSSSSAPASSRRAEASSSGPGACAIRPLLVGLTMRPGRARARIDARVDEMVAAGAAEEARRAAEAAPRARPARRSASTSSCAATSRRSSAPTAPTPGAS